MGPAVVLATGGVLGVAALALTPWVRRLGGDSVWTASGLHALLACLGGAGAASVAGGPAELVALAVAALACALLVVVDLAAHRLPDLIVLPALAATAAALAVAGALGHPWADLVRALAAGAVLAGGYFVLCLLAPTGLGLGDVKLAALLGVVLGWFGWSHLLVGTLAAFVLGGLFAVALLLVTDADRRTPVAFGPWMVMGAVVGVAWGPVLLGA